MSRAVLLFEDERLLDASDRARSLFGAEPGLFEWSQLHKKLSEQFLDFPESPSSVPGSKDLILTDIASDAPVQYVCCERLDGMIRVTLHSDFGRHDSDQSRLAIVPDVNDLALDLAPYPIWRTDTEGNLVWKNEAYAELARKAGRDPAEQPADMFAGLSSISDAGRRSRISVPVRDQEIRLWYEATVVDQENGRLFYAVDANAVVDAETAQRNFVQTLAKTFAQLSIGLAIFDRNRQLALFNPALVDLTSLPAEFLSARPDLLSFFDRLRDQNMMLEPKNYGGWRQQMAELVEAAADGKYQETWSLPSGSVYSVSGRPHPDGAIAFLFEDITAEITLTRRFRSELELGHAVLDRLDDAICVFVADGSLAFSNRAYRDLWNVDPDLCFSQTTILDATRTWQGLSHATPVWGDIRDFMACRENRAEWWASVNLRSGKELICEVSPIQNGATMICFRTSCSRDPKPLGTETLAAIGSEPA